jgi:PAS domain S-box-containing protein
MVGGTDPVSVLYVDDQRDAGTLAATRLEDEADRLSITTELTAADALEELAERDVDCIVSDYHLADSDGVAFLEAVRAESPELPFIIFTRTGNEETASAAISAGVTDYVVEGVVESQYELLASSILDAVDRRRAEQTAARTERLLHELTEQTNDVQWMFAADWSETLFINSAYEEIFGQPTERLSEDPTAFVETVHPDDRDELTRAMERVADGESVDVTYRVRPAPDETRWVESHGEPVREDGEVTRIAGFSRDITERRQAKEELRERNEELDMFTSVVSHDLRSPLNLATGFLSLLDETSDADEIPPIRRSLDRMDRLIGDLLTLSRRGEVTDDMRRVELARVAEDYWQEAAADDATLRVVDAVSLDCDPTRLGQALDNLYRNAIEHTDGEVTVTVGRIEGRSGFYVEDDGPGIPEGEQAALLGGWQERAVQSEQLSLGIAIVERIVDAHGWTVDIADSTGGGARFEITGVDSIRPEQ